LSKIEKMASKLEKKLFFSWQYFSEKIIQNNFLKKIVDEKKMAAIVLL